MAEIVDTEDCNVNTMNRKDDTGDCNIKTNNAKKILSDPSDNKSDSDKLDIVRSDNITSESVNEDDNKDLISVNEDESVNEDDNKDLISEDRESDDSEHRINEGYMKGTTTSTGTTISPTGTPTTQVPNKQHQPALFPFTRPMIFAVICAGVLTSSLIYILSNTQYADEKAGVTNDELQLCEEHIKQLNDQKLELANIKSNFEQHINSPKKMKSIVDDLTSSLVEKIQVKSSQIQSQLQEELDYIRKQVDNQLGYITTKNEVIDRTIAKISDTRTPLTGGALRVELSTSRRLIDELKSFKDKYRPPRPPGQNFDKLFFNNDKIKHLEDTLEKIFSLEFTDYNNKPLPVAHWKFTAENGGTDISIHGENPVMMHGLAYGPGPKNEPEGAVILPTSSYQSMIVTNPTGKLRFTKEMTYYTHIYTDGTKLGPLFEYNIGSSDPTSVENRGTNFWIWPDVTSLDLEHFGGETDLVIKNVLAPKHWHKIVLTCSMSQVAVYVNGKLVGRQDLVTDLSKTQVGHIYIGRLSHHLLRGRMASAKFYDVQLTETEIQDL